MQGSSLVAKLAYVSDTTIASKVREVRAAPSARSRSSRPLVYCTSHAWRLCRLSRHALWRETVAKRELRWRERRVARPRARPVKTSVCCRPATRAHPEPTDARLVLYLLVRRQDGPQDFRCPRASSCAGRSSRPCAGGVPQDLTIGLRRDGCWPNQRGALDVVALDAVALGCASFRAGQHEGPARRARARQTGPGRRSRQLFT